MTSSRTCNALEALFVQCNIRFATGVSFEPVPVEQAEAALRTGLQVSGLDRLQMDHPDESLPRVSLLESSSSPLASPQHVRITDTLSQTLEELVARDAPAIGGVSTCLLIDDADDSSAIGVVINANHALCDGRLMRMCIESVLQRLMGMPTPLIELGTLGDLNQALRKTVLPLEPRFLPLKGSSILKVNEIPQFLADTPSELSPTVRSDIDASTVTACRHRLQSEATLTGFMMACWVQAISEVSSRTDAITMTDAAAPVVSISCLVEIRSQLPPALYTNAFGTVTVSGIGSSSNNKKQQQQDQDHLASFLVDLAKSCTEDLQTRIQRGEALLQSLALCQGEFDDDTAASCPPGTIELSNHGVYNTTACTRELALEQRFDGYDGISVLMVTESNSGVLRLTANAGAMFRRAAIEGLMSRVVELWHVVAAKVE